MYDFVSEVTIGLADSVQVGDVSRYRCNALYRFVPHQRDRRGKMGQMAANGRGFTVENHPQKAKIIEGLLAGTALRTLGSSVVPPVSHAALDRYKHSVIKPMLARAEESGYILGLRKGEIIEKKAPEPFVGETEARQVIQKAIQDAPALHIRENRIKAKADRWNRLQMIVDARAKDMPDVPGGESGFLARDFKGAGENLQEVYKFDDALHKAFGELEKDTAIEMGQWQENAGGGSVSIQIVCPTQPGEQPRITFARDEGLLIEGEAEEEGMQDIGILQR